MGEKRDQLLYKSRKNHKGQLYKQWREAVLQRGNYHCSLCSSTQNLTADHIKPVISHPELAFTVNNGRILCESCRVKDMLNSWQNGLFKSQRAIREDKRGSAMKQRSQLGNHRPDYTFTCGICGVKIEGKTNTIHLAIGSHVKSEFRKGLRDKPNTSPREYGDKGKKLI